MTENEGSGGLTYKLYKDEDFPQTPPVADPAPVDAPVESAPAEPVPVIETIPAAEPVDIGKLISERLGRPEEEIKQQLSELEQLRKFSAENEEFIADDDFLKNFHKSYKNGGKTVLEQYIDAMSVDFAKMTPEQVVEYNVRRELGKSAPKSVVEKSYRAKLAEFGWEEDLVAGTPEHQAFQESLTWNADKLREKLASEQQSFKIPERQAKAAEPGIDQAAIDAYISQTRNDVSTRSLLEQKAVKIGEFQVPVDPESLVSQALDTNSFLQKFIKQDGSVDYAKFYQMAAIAEIGPEEFYRKSVADAVAAEKLKWIAATKNPTTDDPKPVDNGNVGFKVKFMQ